MPPSAAELLSALNPDLPPSEVFRVLVSLRTKYLKSSLSSALVEAGLVHKLVGLLHRPNSKIIDVTLSILGNLMLEDTPRKQIRDRGLRGVPILVGVISTLSEEGILSRATRTVANMAQDTKNATLLHAEGIFPLLIKTLGEVGSPKTKQVVVRAIRILGSTKEHKKLAVDAQAIAAVSRHLQSEDEDLLKAVTKCLAHFTHGCTEKAASQVRGEDGMGFQRMADLVIHPKRSIWEASMACLINLSHIDSLRPSLGNAGTVKVLVEKMNANVELSEKERAHAITALCLYCRESVNRMKLRESGGLKLFVHILTSAEYDKLHDRIINSLLQFGYDDLSLRVLQEEGLIPCLIRFVEEYTNQNGTDHDCATEICQFDYIKCGQEEAEAAEAIDEQQEEREEAEEEVSSIMDDENHEDDEDPSNEVGESEISDEKRETRFRVNSPSYQAVQDEFEQMKRLCHDHSSVFSQQQCPPPQWNLESPDGSFCCQSPDQSPLCWNSPGGYSPSYSPPSYSNSSSTQASPNQSPESLSRYSSSSDVLCYSPFPEYSNIIPSCPPGDKEDEEGNIGFSPVEQFSDDEETKEEVKVEAAAMDCAPSTSAAAAAASSMTSLSPPQKRSRMDSPAKLVTPSPNGFTSIFSPSYTASFNNFTPWTLSELAPMAQPKPDHGANGGTTAERSRIGWVLQILSRLSQAERPHENLTDRCTMKALIRYLSQVQEPLTRAGRILMRLSKNLYCVMAMVQQRHLSWLHQNLASRPTLPDSNCESCKNLFLLQKSLLQNVSLLAESGYAEGQMCHILMRGLRSEKQAVAISTPMIVKPRKLLRNILITHDGLEILLDILETSEVHEDETLFSDAVLSVSTLAGHVGVIAPNLKLEEKVRGHCKFSTNRLPTDLLLILDDGSEVPANREVICESSSVFQAMLVGQFAESGQDSIRLPITSNSALTHLLHYLYGCRWCRSFDQLDVSVLLELVLMSDKYLLGEFNKSVSHEIVQRCLAVDQVVGIYEGSLQKAYPVRGTEEPLSSCAVNYLLVGEMKHGKRVEVFRELLKSKMNTDFIEDVSKTLREKLLEL